MYLSLQRSHKKKLAPCAHMSPFLLFSLNIDKIPNSCRSNAAIAIVAMNDNIRHTQVKMLSDLFKPVTTMVKLFDNHCQSYPPLNKQLNVLSNDDHSY